MSIPVNVSTVLEDLERLVAKQATEIAELKRNRMGVMVQEVRSGPIRMVAERLRDITTGELGPIMFNMTYDNDVSASMGKSQAALFARFVNDVLECEEPGVTQDRIAMLKHRILGLESQVATANERAEMHRAEIVMFKRQSDELRDANMKLQRFKDFVHDRLTQAGVPVDPGGPHSMEGCRIGDRLDLALDQYRA